MSWASAHKSVVDSVIVRLTLDVIILFPYFVHIGRGPGGDLRVFDSVHSKDRNVSKRFLNYFRSSPVWISYLSATGM